MTPHRHWLRDYKPFYISIKLADHTIIYSAGIGSVLYKPLINGVESQSLLFSKVLHVPQLQTSLLSILFLTKHRDYKIFIDSQQIQFLRYNRILLTASINSQNAAFLDGITVPASLSVESANLSSILPLDLSLWHRRLDHTNHGYVKQLHSKDMVTGMKISNMSRPDPICEPCLAGKMHANPFPTFNSRASKPLELVHIDLKGPIQVKSIAGYYYWIQFVDDCTRFKCGLELRKKSEAFAAFLQFKAYAENLHDAKIKVIREDKGSEFMSNEFNQYCIDNGIQRQHTVRNRLQQNGDVERANRTVSDQVTAMLNEANLPVQFWFHAFVALLHVLNRSPTAPLSGQTPYKAWYRRKPDVSHLRVWGCLAYVHVQKDKRKSFGSHMEKCIFIGYPAGYKGWQFYNPVTRKFIISERAEFDERYLPGIKPTLLNSIPTPPSFNLINGSDMPDLGGHHINTNQSATSKVSTSVVQMPMQSSSPKQTHSPLSNTVQSPLSPIALQLPDIPPSPTIPSSSPSPSPPPTPPLALRRSRRNIQPPGQWWRVRHPTPAIESDTSESDSGEPNLQESSSEDEDSEVAAVARSFHEPNTYKQAMKSPDAVLWRKAAEEEINSLLANGTWELVPLPEGKKAIGSRWVFKVKKNADGSIERYKARLVAKGFSQRPGLDYNEVYAPTFRMASIFLFFIFIFIFIFSTIYNAVLDRSLRARNTNSMYSKTMLHIAQYYIPGPWSLLLAGDYRHKACSLFQDDIALLSGECGCEPAGCGDRHVHPRIALGKVPQPEPTTEGGAVARRR
jgi:transposase InsO family protein